MEMSITSPVEPAPQAAQGPVVVKGVFCGQRYRVRPLDLSAIEVPSQADDGFVDKLGVLTERLHTRKLAPILGEVARQNGFDCISYTCWMPRLGGESTYWVHGPLPNETRIAYHSRNLLETDEVVRHCKTSHVPAVWRVDQALKTQAPDLHRAMSNSYRSRISFPVHGPYREWGAVSFNSRLPDVWADLQARRYQVLCEGQLLAQYIHQWVTASGLLWDLSELGTVTLKDKEKEVLRLGALGFESHEIGPLVGLSKRSVDYVFQQIARKLQVTNRQESITTALELGLIAL